MFVTSSEIFRGQNFKPETYGITWRFHENGIFSENVFGPIYDFTCACNVIHPPGSVCPVCGVKSEPSYVRRYRIGKIKLLYPIPHPIILVQLSKYRQLVNLFVLDDDGNISERATGIYSDKTVISSFGIFVHILSQVYKLTTEEYLDLIREKTNSEISDILYNPNHYDYYHIIASPYVKKIQERGIPIADHVPVEESFVNVLNVLPAGLRDMSVIHGKSLSVLTTHRINLDYLNLLKAAEKLSIQEPGMFHMAYSTILNSVLNIQTILISSLVKKKHGPIRGLTLGRRVDLSARAVLTGNPYLKPDEIMIPYICAFMLLEDVILEYLFENNYDVTRVLDMIYETKQVPTYVKRVIDDWIENKGLYVLLMRQPVLHLPSTMQFRVASAYDGYAIQMNQLSWEGYNADADGDTVVIFRLDAPNNKFDVSAHLYVPYGALNVGIAYDSLAGFVMY